VSQPYNSTQSPRRYKTYSKPYTPYPKSHHLPKIVRSTSTILPAYHLAHPVHPHALTTHPLYAVKVGYPPRALTAVIPELPLSSLGLAPGDQLIVVQKSGSAAAAPTSTSTPSSSSVNPGHTPAATATAVVARPTPPTAIEDDGPDYVTTDGGYLIHRVRAHPSSIDCVRGTSSLIPSVAVSSLVQIVPDDNSCMFASIALVFEQDMRKAPMIRQGTSVSPRVDRSLAFDFFTLRCLFITQSWPRRFGVIQKPGAMPS
jgi:hypothetical protein